MARFFAAVFSLCLVIAGCASKRAVFPVDQVVEPRFEVAWEEYRPGMDLFRVEIDQPPMRGWAVRIDLGSGDLTVMVTPGEGNTSGGVTGWFSGSYTSSFLDRYGLDLAVNASPFYPVVLGTGTSQQVAGLSVSDSLVYSMPSGESKYAALLFRPAREGGYRASVDTAPFDLEGVVHGAGGFYQVLEDGDVTAPEVGKRHPMTLAGVDESGRTLYLLVVDGRQPRKSVGMTPREGALWLQHLGADDGLHFDGGGSSTLVIRGEDGRPAVINRPVDARLLYKQRVVANHLGFGG